MPCHLFLLSGTLGSTIITESYMRKSTPKNWQVVSSYCPLFFFSGFNPIFWGLKLQVMKRQTWQTPVSYMANHRMVGWNLPTVGSGGSTEGPEPKNFERRLDEHVATWVPNLPQSRWTFRGLVEGVEPRVDLMEQVAWKPQQKGIWIGIRWHWGSLNISILHLIYWGVIVKEVV